MEKKTLYYCWPFISHFVNYKHNTLNYSIGKTNTFMCFNLTHEKSDKRRLFWIILLVSFQFVVNTQRFVQFNINEK